MLSCRKAGLAMQRQAQCAFLCSLPCIENEKPRTFYKVVGVVKHSFGNTSPPRAGSGVKGAPRSGAFIVDP